MNYRYGLLIVAAALLSPACKSTNQSTLKDDVSIPSNPATHAPVTLPFNSVVIWETWTRGDYVVVPTEGGTSIISSKASSNPDIQNWTSRSNAQQVEGLYQSQGGWLWGIFKQGGYTTLSAQKEGAAVPGAAQGTVIARDGESTLVVAGFVGKKTVLLPLEVNCLEELGRTGIVVDDATLNTYLKARVSTSKQYNQQTQAVETVSIPQTVTGLSRTFYGQCTWDFTGTQR